jgi:uncharacterized protein
MDDTKVQKQIDIYLKRVKSAYKPDRVILYGSYAKGQQSPFSDVDMLVISKKFENMDTYDRFSKLYDLGSDLSLDFNAIGFTPEEVKALTYQTTVKDALLTGREIG